MMIGYYEQVTAFSTENAGTSEWCKAKKDGKQYFIKKFQKPVYPSKDLGLSEAKYEARVKRFHAAKTHYEHLYSALRSNNTSGALVVPEEVISYQFHLCTVTDFISGNVKPNEVCKLSEWQRLVLMRTLTLAVMNVHSAGIVHGDMKPDNILITQDPKSGACVLKLIDFDSSYFTSSAPESADDIAGDMAYWAPEVLAKFTNESIVLDKSVDNFALGLILHYLWTGDIPQKPADKTIGECMLSGMTITLDTSLPLVLNKIISGLIEADPQRRLSCQNVYDILGIQLDHFPKVVKFLRDERPKFAQINILFTDSKGNLIHKTSTLVNAGESISVVAKQFAGYKLVSAEKIQVNVDETGVPNTTAVTFIYQKHTHIVRKILIAISAALIMFFSYMFFSIEQAIQLENWEKADKTMSLIPMYESFFSKRFLYVQEQLLKGVTNKESRLDNPIATPATVSLSLSCEGDDVQLQWTKANITSLTYMIYRKEGSSFKWMKIGEVYGSYTYVDKTVLSGLKYEYKVIVEFGGIEYVIAQNSIIVEAKVRITASPTKKPTDKPVETPSPVTLSLSCKGEDVQLGWTKTNITAPYFLVYRKASFSSKWTKIGEVYNNYSFFDKTVIPNITYFYKINVIVDGTEYSLTQSSINIEPISQATPQPTQHWKVGHQCRVTVNEGRVRKKPSPNDATSPAVNYVKYGEVFTILDCVTGDTNKDWYLINCHGIIGWISSGISELID